MDVTHHYADPGNWLFENYGYPPNCIAENDRRE
jgi:hypothetical protein